MNAASPIPEGADHTDPRFKPGNVIVSYRYINTLAVVDRDTKKIVWKTVGLTIGQHNPHFVPGGLPGTGNLLVFDNGYVDGNTNPYRASTRPYSRVLETQSCGPVDRMGIHGGKQQSADLDLLQSLHQRSPAAAQRKYSYL